MATSAAELSAVESYLLRWCTERAVTDEVDEILKPVIAGASKPVDELLTELASGHTAFGFLVRSMSRFPGMADRIKGPGISEAARKALDSDYLSILAGSPGFRGRVIFCLTAVFFSGFTGGKSRPHQGSCSPALAALQAFAGSGQLDGGIEPMVSAWVELLGGVHAATELPGGDIGFLAFRHFVQGGLLAATKDSGKRTALRLAATLLPQRVIAAILAKGASAKTTETLLNVLLKRRALFGNRSFAYHITVHSLNAKGIKAAIKGYTSALPADEKELLETTLQPIRPLEGKKSDPRELLRTTLSLWKTAESQGLPQAVSTILMMQVDYYRAKVPHFL